MHANDRQINRNVSRETLEPLKAYVAFLLKWNAKINLIGAATESLIWQRHIDDALQLLPLIPDTTKSVADLGSGAGLPGMVIALMRPNIAVTLIEIDQRKAAFLHEAKRFLGLSQVTVVNADIRAVNDRFDMVVARALAPLNTLLLLAAPLGYNRTTYLFPKGETAAGEIESARQAWSFACDVFASQTQRGAQILRITSLIPR